MARFTPADRNDKDTLSQSSYRHRPVHPNKRKRRVGSCASESGQFRTYAFAISRGKSSLALRSHLEEIRHCNPIHDALWRLEQTRHPTIFIGLDANAELRTKLTAVRDDALAERADR